MTQFIDLDGDEKPDQIIFQSDFGPKESKHFHVVGSLDKMEVPESKLKTFARFVPERSYNFV